jgi:hypothetical protein
MTTYLRVSGCQPDPLITDTMDQFPVYIRFEPTGSSPDWCLDFVEVRVNPVGDTTQDKKYFALPGSGAYLWLGQHYGKYPGLFEDKPPV